MGAHHDRSSTARGTAIQNGSFVLLVALTTLAFLALIRDFAGGGPWRPWPRS